MERWFNLSSSDMSKLNKTEIRCEIIQSEIELHEQELKKVNDDETKEMIEGRIEYLFLERERWRKNTEAEITGKPQPETEKEKEVRQRIVKFWQD